MPPFNIVSDFHPTGDQPQAVDKLVEGVPGGMGKLCPADRGAHRPRRRGGHGRLKYCEEATTDNDELLLSNFNHYKIGLLR